MENSCRDIMTITATLRSTATDYAKFGNTTDEAFNCLVREHP